MVKQWVFRTILVLVGVFGGVSLGWGEMLISPTRALLDDDTRSASLVLRNTSSGARTYRLEWEDKRATELGRYQPIKEGEDWPSAGAMIRFSPRQITVGPGENQTVRLNYRPPADLAPGEYRSHLRLQVMEDVSEPTGVMEMDDPDRDGVGFRLFMQMSFSVPVIVRHNVDAPQVEISNVEVLPAEQGRAMALAVTLDRQGESSSFGELVVEMQQNATSPVETIGRNSEISVFHELNQKIVRVVLRDVGIPPGAWIRVAYEGKAEYKGRIWDEQVFQSE